MLSGDEVPAPLTVASALTSWDPSLTVIVPLFVVAVAYVVGVSRARSRWPARWTISFLAGLLVVAVATQSSVAVYDGVLFSDHMVQHLLLIMVAPPLLVVGRPVTLLLHVTRNPAHQRVKAVLRSRAVSALTWPGTVVVLYTLVVALTHLTPFMNEVLTHEWVHDLEHVLYLGTGYLYFLPIVGAEPIRWRLSVAARFLLVVITMPVDTFVGVALMIVPHELFPAYLHDGRTWGPTPLADLHRGGQIMWIGSDILMAGIAIVLARRFTWARERPSSDRDRRHQDVQLASYNAYLGALHDGTRPKP